MKSQIQDLLDVLTQKGSRLQELLHPGMVEEELLFSERECGLEFPSELRDYLAVFGHGRRRDVPDVRDVDSQIIQDFMSMSYTQSLAAIKRHGKTIVFGEDLFSKPASAYPVLFSGGEYISLIWSPQDYAVVWKINDWDFPSWRWPSLESFFVFASDCWKEGACEFDFDNDQIKWNAGIAEDILGKCGGSVIER